MPLSQAKLQFRSQSLSFVERRMQSQSDATRAVLSREFVARVRDFIAIARRNRVIKTHVWHLASVLYGETGVNKSFRRHGLARKLSVTDGRTS